MTCVDLHSQWQRLAASKFRVSINHLRFVTGIPVFDGDLHVASDHIIKYIWIGVTALGM
jgi:hypothetical protein